MVQTPHLHVSMLGTKCAGNVMSGLCTSTALESTDSRQMVKSCHIAAELQSSSFRHSDHHYTFGKRALALHESQAQICISWKWDNNSE